MRTRAKTAYRDESRFFYMALTLLVVTACMYAYFLSASVVHVVMRKEVDADIAAASSGLAELEGEYIELQHSLSADIATYRGFVVATEKLFIDPREGAIVLSRN